MQSRRDAKAAKRFVARLMKKQCRVPRVLVTDKLKSYGAAHRELIASVEYRSHKGLNNRAENSHQPTRQRERAMKYFRSPSAAQRFLSAFSGISPHFRPRRHLLTAAQHRFEMTLRFTLWTTSPAAPACPPRPDPTPETRPHHTLAEHTRINVTTHPTTPNPKIISPTGQRDSTPP